MKTFIVFVKFRIPGIGLTSDSRVRYIDSQWADKEHAVNRKHELGGSFQMFGLTDWDVSIIEGTVSDASVPEVFVGQDDVVPG